MINFFQDAASLNFHNIYFFDYRCLKGTMINFLGHRNLQFRHIYFFDDRRSNGTMLNCFVQKVASFNFNGVHVFSYCPAAVGASRCANSFLNANLPSVGGIGAAIITGAASGITFHKNYIIYNKKSTMFTVVLSIQYFLRCARPRFFYSPCISCVSAEPLSRPDSEFYCFMFIR